MQKSFALQFMEVLEKRCQLNRKGKRYLQAQKDGYDGEVDFQKIVRQTVPADWVLLTDKFYQLKFNSGQIDAILVSPCQVYVFEVKNLKANYEYRNGRWTVDDFELSHDYFDQMKHSVKLIRKLLQELEIKVPVVGRLVLINENETVEIHDNMDGLYLNRWHLRDFLQKASNESSYPKFNSRQLAEVLNRHASPQPLPNKKPWDFGEDIYKGIVCGHCHHHGVNTTEMRFRVLCERCGFAEARRTAVLRTVCEMGLLYFDKPLTKRFIVECINDEGLEYVIRDVFLKYMEFKKNGKGVEYVNPMQIIEYAFPEVFENQHYKSYFVARADEE